jgi:hypothetical protein
MWHQKLRMQGQTLTLAGPANINSVTFWYWRQGESPVSSAHCLYWMCRTRCIDTSVLLGRCMRTRWRGHILHVNASMVPAASELNGFHSWLIRCTVSEHGEYESQSNSLS